MTFISRSIQRAAMMSLVAALGVTSSPGLAKNFGLTMQSAQVAKRVKPARPAAPERARSQTVTTTLSCQGGDGVTAWSCPGIAQPGTLTSLTYKVSLDD